MRNVDISPVELLLTYPSNVILTLRHWRKLDYRVWLPTAVVIVIGSLLVLLGTNVLQKDRNGSRRLFFACCGLVSVSSLPLILLPDHLLRSLLIPG